jgi:hypothetical protein
MKNWEFFSIIGIPIKLHLAECRFESYGVTPIVAVGM